MPAFLHACLALLLCTASAVCHAALADPQAPDADSLRSAAAAMNDLESRVRPGKRAFVEDQLQLTTKEAGAFWPLYEDYQQHLSAFNQRRLENILRYAEQYNAGNLQDADALQLAESALKLEKDEAVHMQRAFQKISKVLPGIKAARYMQIEAKIRALVRYEQAARVPLAP